MSHAVVCTSLEAFARTGKLGPLDFGLPRERVADLLGRPTRILHGFVPECSDIWLYGDAGVYFEGERVYLIHFEEFEVPCGGGGLALDPWVVRRGLRLEALQQALDSASIVFRTEPGPMSEYCKLVTTSAGVYFIVQIEGEPDELGLWAFGRRETV